MDILTPLFAYIELTIDFNKLLALEIILLLCSGKKLVTYACQLCALPLLSPPNCEIGCASYHIGGYPSLRQACMASASFALHQVGQDRLRLTGYGATRR